MALRRLPCNRCPEGAWLKDGTGKAVVPYLMGMAPSAFRTTGEAFEYDCQRCERFVHVNGKPTRSRAERQSISKRAFYALPDLEATPKPAA